MVRSQAMMSSQLEGGVAAFSWGSEGDPFEAAVEAEAQSSQCSQSQDASVVGVEESQTGIVSSSPSHPSL